MDQGYRYSSLLGTGSNVLFLLAPWGPLVGFFGFLVLGPLIGSFLQVSLLGLLPHVLKIFLPAAPVPLVRWSSASMPR